MQNLLVKFLIIDIIISQLDLIYKNHTYFGYKIFISHTKLSTNVFYTVANTT